MRPAEIRRLEETADRAWPAAEAARGPGWEARFAHGMHRRLNSATVWEAADLGETVARIEGWYAARGRPAIFKLTGASAPGLDRHLAAAGYEPDALVQIMTAAPDTAPAGPSSPSHRVGLDEAPSAAWADSFAAMSGYGSDRRRLLDEVLGRITLPSAYAAVHAGGEIVSVGMAVAEGGHAGVFEMATDPAHRGRGMARSVLGALMGWMRPRAVTTAYLQVLDGNTPAERLYRAAGFAPRYRYWYRMPPDGLSTMPR